MLKFLTLFTFLIVFETSSQSLKLSELDSSQYFDFWEGKWDASWKEGEAIGKGTNQLTWIMGGKVLQEDFRVL